LAALCILTTCDILKKTDENGKTIEPGMELESAITAYVMNVDLDRISG
jgi:hypothetical protein